ncbi:MAG: hypothetical protein FJ149_01720 [Euryarchaeota archaeon]|nr:hypothetical protein [Euryarchaeota archaeon]
MEGGKKRGGSDDGERIITPVRTPPPAPTMPLRKVPEPERWEAVPVGPEGPPAPLPTAEAVPPSEIPVAEAELVDAGKEAPRPRIETAVRKVPRRPKARKPLRAGDGAPRRAEAALKNRGGLTNGRGLTNGNGLVNGRGLADGKGFVNGRRPGMVNGRGPANGRGAVDGNGMALDERPLPKRARAGWVAAAVVASLLLAFAVGYLLLASTEKGVRVDGAFSDWSGVKRIPDSAGDATNPETDITETAVAADGTSVSFYVRTGDRMLGGRQNGVDTVCLFIDSDRSDATGYSAGSVGAEYVIVVDGYDGRVSAAGLYRFPADGGRPANDWNSRAASGSVRAAASGNELEVQSPLSDLGGSARLNVQAYVKDGAGSEDFGRVMSPGKSSLSVSWRQAGPVSASPGQSGVELLGVELVSSGGASTVSSLRAWANPGTTSTDIGRMALFTSSGQEIPGTQGTINGGSVTFRPRDPLKVGAGETLTLSVRTDLPSDSRQGRAIGLSMLSPQDVGADTGAVTVNAGTLRPTYVGSGLARISIDGAFSDWDAVPAHPDPRGDVSDPDIDLVDFRLTNDSGSLCLMARVDGRMMGGESVPESKLRPSGGGGGGGGPVTLPVLAGEDALFVFVDTDADAATGYSGGGLPVGAERLVRVTGQGGRITASKVLPFTGGTDRQAWSWGAGSDVVAATDRSALEAAVALGELGSPAGNIGVYYYTTDWRSARDGGDRLGLDLRGGGGRALPGELQPALDETGAPRSTGDGPLHAPEFREVLVPLLGVSGAFFLVRRTRHRRPRKA